ncbi:hypothetical protein [Aurantibacter sp.]|uniref:hypothetical protein n=1 Tax=Aurantibacter sp. TaxID=2807103 RepID=UPI003264DEF3
MKRTNIQEKLVKERKRHLNTEEDIANIYAILEQNQTERDSIKNNILKGSTFTSFNYDLDLLASENIFHIAQIKNICVAYRLRFLDSKLFKGEIPEEAISKIRQLEKEHEMELSGFKVLAPSKLFKLKDKDDPILFAPLGNGYFYLIYKWGNDLHPLRKLLMWPFKNIINLVWFTLLVSLIITTLIPSGLFSKSTTVAQFGLLFFFSFKSIAAVVVYYAFAQGKNFSNAIWNSKYINT